MAEPQDIKRLNYFTNQFLREGDFQDEQLYHRQMRYLHNQRMHGTGVVYGMTISRGGDRSVSIGEGLAIDKEGQEMWIPAGLSYALTTSEKGKSIYLTLTFGERGDTPYTVPGLTDKFIRTLERPQFEEVVTPSADAIVLAKLDLDANGNITAVNSAPSERKSAGAVVAPNSITLNQLAPSIRPFTLDGVSNPGGNIDLVANNAITLTPNNNTKQIAIGESHSARTDNPHGTTAAQVGALPITGGALRGNLDITGRLATNIPNQGGTVTLFPPDGAAWFHLDNPGIRDNPVGRLRVTHGANPGDNQIMSFLQNGNVGIGTDTPSTRLQVMGTTTLMGGDLVLQATANDPGDVVFQDSNRNQKGRIWSNTAAGAAGLYLSSGDNNPDIVIEQNGSVQVANSLTIGSVAMPSLVGRVVVSGPVAELSFMDRRLTTWPVTPAAGDRFLWYTDGRVARLWTEVRGDLLTVDSIGTLRATGIVNTPSSRQLKENIVPLSGKEAVNALEGLNPIKFNYKLDDSHEPHLGFIAEDVPDLVAKPGRKILNSMDIVAVLTKALQEQQQSIAKLTDQVHHLESMLNHYQQEE